MRQLKSLLVAWNVLRGPWAAALKEDIHKTAGFRVLELAENGFRDFTNSKHLILSPADLKAWLPHLLRR